MAILAGAVVSITTANILQVQQDKVNLDLDAIKTASHMLHNDCGAGCWGDGAITGGLTAGVGLISAPTLAPCPATCVSPLWNGPYISGWGKDPWDNPYRMIWSAAGSGSLNVASWGEDNASGGTGANADISTLITGDITK